MHGHVPIGGDDRELVLEKHSISYPGREVESLRHHKFAQLHRLKTPTGDPRCPQEVKLVKRITYVISSHAEIGDGMEEMDLAEGIFLLMPPLLRKRRRQRCQLITRR
jgi:hypothetical protein